MSIGDSNSIQLKNVQPMLERFKTAVSDGVVKILEAAGSDTAYTVFMDTEHMLGGEYGSEYKATLENVQVIIEDAPKNVQVIIEETPGVLRDAGKATMDMIQKKLGSAGSPGVYQSLKKAFVLGKDGKVSKGKVLLISLAATSTLLGAGFIISSGRKKDALIAAQRQQIQRQSQMISQIHDRVVPQQQQAPGTIAIDDNDDEPIQVEQIDNTAKSAGLAALAMGTFMALGYLLHSHNCSQ